jgi:Flp pilus assembly pilin Flp
MGGMHRVRQRPGIRRLSTDERGALAVEYLVVTMVGLMVAIALMGLGAVMVDAYGESIKFLYSQYP